MKAVDRDAGELRPAESAAAVAALFPVMRQLRAHLASAVELVERWERQSAAGYRLLAAYRDEVPVALAGYRLTENLVYGRFLYVDDLVTDEAERRKGWGERLMARLVREARAAGCRKLVLDTPLANVLGHRFYYRTGLLGAGLHFTQALD